MSTAMPDMPINVPIDDPNADTEWNDILRKHGVIPEKPPSPTRMLEEAVDEARLLAHEHRLEGKDLEELEELEDVEDEAFLREYKQKRLQELTTLSKSSIHGQVYHLQKPEYSHSVTTASKSGRPVLVLLTSSNSGNVESRLLAQLWTRAAEKYLDVKFCQIKADMCIEGYPEKNCPTVLVYWNEEIVKQIVGLRELGGTGARLGDIENLLISVDAIQNTDRRLKEKEEEGGGIKRVSGKQARVENDDDDDDWD